MFLLFLITVFGGAYLLQLILFFVGVMDAGSSGNFFETKRQALKMLIPGYVFLVFIALFLYQFKKLK